MSDNSFSWKRFFGGIVNPINTAKVSAHYLHVALIVLVVFGCVKVGVWLKNWIFPAQAVGAKVENVSGGTVDASSNKRVKNSIIGIG